MTVAPVTALSGPYNFPTSDCAECSSPGRSAKSVNMQKKMPWFGPEPPNPKPPMSKVYLISGIVISTCSTCFSMFIV
jgi:hypothetical protein